jgi:hypothetical protein
LVHGYGPKAYHHFSVTSLHKSDSNATVTSLAKVLRDLENWNGDRSGDLAFCPNDNSKEIFQALLDREAFEEGYLARNGYGMDKYRDLSNEASPEDATSSEQPLDGFKMLPRNLLSQMDKSWKDNKN